MSHFHYFAYGSNMLCERLRARCPSAEPVCTATVTGHVLSFEKKSIDTSGKATIRASGLETDKVHGVVFHVRSDELVHLDMAEGHPGHYLRETAFRVRRLDTGTYMTVTTYFAHPEKVVADLKPYNWYLDLVIAGARQQGLPEDYIALLEGVATVVDQDRDRPARAHALDILKRANVLTA